MRSRKGLFAIQVSLFTEGLRDAWMSHPLSWWPQGGRGQRPGACPSSPAGKGSYSAERGQCLVHAVSGAAVRAGAGLPGALTPTGAALGTLRVPADRRPRASPRPARARPPPELAGPSVKGLSRRLTAPRERAASAGDGHQRKGVGGGRPAGGGRAAARSPAPPRGPEARRGWGWPSGLPVGLSATEPPSKVLSCLLLGSPERHSSRSLSAR